MCPRILAVDDSKLTLNLMSAMLTRAGHDVQTASSGPEALDLVEKFQPDLIILDVMMPGMDGYEVCRRLRQLPVSTKTPVIMVTALGSLEDKIKGFEAGADDYMLKPFETAELQARIDVLLRRSPKMLTTSDALTVPSKTLAVFSLRGGVGVSTLAANLAVGLAQLWEQPTVLVDLALVTGQAALMLNLPLRHTWAELADIATSEIDAMLLDSLLLEHESGVRVLAAPRQPEHAARVTEEKIVHTLSLLQKHYQYVVLDLAHDFHEPSLAGLDAADLILTVMAPELASVRLMASTLDVFSILEYPREKISFVLNNTFERRGLDSKDIEDTLKHPVELEMPFAPDIFVPALNSGIPTIQDEPHGRIGSQLEDFCFDISQDAHREQAPENPTDAWRRIDKRRGKRRRLW